MAVKLRHSGDQAFHAFVEHIVAAFGPRRVVWFGSRAQGKPFDVDSDYDLLVEFEAVDDWMALTRQLRDSHPHPFPLDLLVRSFREIEAGLAAGDEFLTDVFTLGQVLHEQ